LKQIRSHLVNISLGIIVASFFIILSQTVFFKRIESIALDAFFHLRGNPSQPSDDIVIVEITNNDIGAVGRWPWSRKLVARLNDALKAFGVQEVFYDSLFNAPTDEAGDRAFEASIKSTGNVYLPSFLAYSQGDISETVKPLERLRKFAKGLGFVNIAPDPDGTIRKLQLFMVGKDKIYFNVVLKIVMDRLGLRIKDIRPHELVLVNNSQEVSIPLVNKNALLLNWYGTWDQTFIRFSYKDIVEAYDDVSQGKEPKIDLKVLKDSIVVFALTAVGLNDIKAVPIENEYSGAGVLITALSNIINRHFIYIVPYWINALFIYLVSLIPVLLIEKESPKREVLFIIPAVVIVLIPYALFLHNYKIMVFVPLIVYLGSYIVLTAFHFIPRSFYLKGIERYQNDAIQMKKQNQEMCENLKNVISKKEDLEKINRELDLFVQTVSHDIRSPLSCLLTYADLLQQRIEDSLNVKDKNILNGIFKNIDHLDEMIDNLIETTKTTRMENPYELVDLNKLIKGIIERLEFKIQEANVALCVQENLPEIVCDRIKMGEVFQNLIVNAIKFSSIKTGQPAIDIRYCEKEDCHEFMVKDNGVGIDAKHHKDIFEMFKQVAPSGKWHGWGLGLSIVQNIIADHGGRIWVESAAGQGASFFFTIPKGLQSNKA